MACCSPPLVQELCDLANQIGSCCTETPCSPSCNPPCCQPCTFPFAQVTITCPPPILAPTRPQPVKPLQLPCPIQVFKQPEPTPEERERWSVDNFYNNYNIDYRKHDADNCCCPCPCKPTKKRCEDYTKKEEECVPAPGCPTGFKPCTMKLTPPPGCHPNLPWCAQVQPCPPKPKKKNEKYVPGECRRPCCKHWKPKEGPCLYDEPCLAHCFNHPPGIKPWKNV